MKEIPLTRGLIALVDDDDCEWLSQWQWHCGTYNGHHTYYAARRKRGVGTIGRSTIFMHREILLRHGANYGNKSVTDHINGNGLDNRKINLRLCQGGENQMNMRSRGGASKYKGVLFRKDRNKWIASISVRGRRIHLGTFNNEESSARAYDLAAIKYFGEFAKTNQELGLLGG